MVLLELSVVRAQCALVVSTLGATLQSWNVSDREMLFVSSKSSQPINGGMPLVFPHFGEWDEGKPLHGFARNSIWTVDEDFRQSNRFGLRLKLSDSEETRRLWNHKFELIYDLRLMDDSGQVEVKLQVKNTDEKSFLFHQLYHPYFRVNATTVTVSDLQGLSYIDKTDAFKVKTENRRKVVIDRAVDYVYQGSGNRHVLEDGQRRITIEKSSTLPNTVVWNPQEGWPTHNLLEGEVNQYVCVEPGNVVEKFRLDPGQTWISEMKLKAEFL